MCAVVFAAGCPDGALPFFMPSPEVISEVEPNNTFDSANPATIVTAGGVVLSGNLSPAAQGAADAVDDVDVFSIGSLVAGDRIRADLVTDLDAVVAIFDESQRLFVLGDVPLGDNANRLVDAVVRLGSGNFYVAVSYLPLSETKVAGPYQITVSVERGGPPPGPVAQTVLLNFLGGPVNIGAQSLNLGPFNSGDIDLVFGGMTQRVKNRTVLRMRELFDEFQVAVTSTDETPAAGANRSTIYFGGAEANVFGGVARIDTLNTDRSDVAVVYTQSFQPGRLRDPANVENLDPALALADELGDSLGITAGHEFGHLLGLRHNQRSGLMTYVAPGTTEGFELSLLGADVFPIGKQDPGLILHTVVGRRPMPGAAPVVVELGDFDNDDDLDIVTLNGPGTPIIEFGGPTPVGNTISVFLNNGDGTFGASREFVFGRSLPLFANLVVGDWDKDGDLDLAIGDVANGVAIMSNNGDATFRLTGSILSKSQNAVLAGDLNNDDCLDLTLAYFESGGGHVDAHLNHGNGTFTPAPDCTVFIEDLHESFNPLGAALGQFDSDNQLDVAALSGIPNSRIVAFANDGGNFCSLISETLLPSDAAPSSITAPDLDNDGRSDLIVGALRVDVNSLGGVDYTPGVLVYFNTGVGDFYLPDFYSSSPIVSSFADFEFGPDRVVVADLDNDGFKDIVWVTGDPFEVLPGFLNIQFNLGNGFFAEGTPLPLDVNAKNLALGDLNGNGVLDLVTANGLSQTISVIPDGNVLQRADYPTTPISVQ